MTIKKDMTTQEKMDRLKDMLSDTLGSIKEFQEDGSIYKDTDILGNERNMCDIELSDLWIINQTTTIIYAARELTKLNMDMINDYLISEINLNYDELVELEDRIIERA